MDTAPLHILKNFLRVFVGFEKEVQSVTEKGCTSDWYSGIRDQFDKDVKSFKNATDWPEPPDDAMSDGEYEYWATTTPNPLKKNCLRCLAAISPAMAPSDEKTISRIIGSIERRLDFAHVAMYLNVNPYAERYNKDREEQFPSWTETICFHELPHDERADILKRWHEQVQETKEAEQLADQLEVIIERIERGAAAGADSGGVERDKPPHGDDTTVSTNTATTDVQPNPLDSCSRCERQAYFSFEYVESKIGKRAEDREAWDYLREHGITKDAGNIGELVDYQLPGFDSWSRYLRVARNATGQQKYKRRGRPRITRSIVAGDQVAQQKPAKD